MAFKVTYATMSTDSDELVESFAKGVEEARSWLGKEYPFYIDGAERRSEDSMEERSPIDNDIVIGRFSLATAEDVDDTVAAAEAGFAEWSQTPWQRRVEIMDRVAELISERAYELSALTGFEVGKNQLESLGEVEEAADLIRYYCHQMQDNDGFSVPMGQLSPHEHTKSVLRPYGVWAVISPFNYPSALSAGPAGGALVAGNAVVLKPSEQGFLMGLKLYEIFRAGGVPAGAFHVLTGIGEVAGQALVEHPGVDGITFTGSYDVGMKIYRGAGTDYPRPVICEMGGKNPAIVSAKADIDKASDGVMRSAFGFSGQKCSACSRAYIQREVYDDFVAALKQKAAKLAIGDPNQPGVYMGPVIDQEALKRFDQATSDARSEGRIVIGGERITEGEFERGNFVQPTAVEVPLESRLFKEELFLPFVALAPVDSVEEGLRLANDTPYGLTAGFYSEDQEEIDRFLNGIEAGVVYVNRRAGATTGAWPGVQPFGGWKGSGSSGKAGGGLYYTQLYLREQSQTVVEE